MNRLLSNLLIVAMFLGFTALPFVYGLYYLVLAFCVYGVCFGFEEFLANHYTGNTVSQHIWILNDSKANQGQKLLYSMLIGWICFVLHFVFTDILAKIFFCLFFLGLLIPSIIYKQYFLTIAAAFFALSIGFSDAVALQSIGLTVQASTHKFLLLHPFKGILVLLSMIFGWLCLLIHLGIKFKK